MTEPKRTILFHTHDGVLRPFLWFRSHKRNEIIWAPYGLLSKHPILRSEWPEEEEPAPNERSLKKYFFDARINRNIPIDHISSHADGTFHIKGLGEPVIYQHTMKMSEPPSENTGPFLEFIATTEIATEYPPGTSKGVSSFVVDFVSDGGIELYGAIAGTQFPLKEFLADGLLPYHSLGPTFIIGQYQAGVTIFLNQSNLELSENRPHGTFITFQFHMQSGNIRRKMFLFE